MTFSLRATIRALAAPEHRLSCPTALWRDGLAELARRGEGRHESGAFLLGRQDGQRRRVVRFVYFDELDPLCWTPASSSSTARASARSGRFCREAELQVVADVHPRGRGPARQSHLDRENPDGRPGRTCRTDRARPRAARHPAGGLGRLPVSRPAPVARPRPRAGRFFYVGLWG
ncbi:MAG: hypothetical protein M5U09_26745 [Gammaproteobacteria bacterium]|nr:hypothetical protein [Gammaproteobacteria bacterium]